MKKTLLATLSLGLLVCLAGCQKPAAEHPEKAEIASSSRKTTTSTTTLPKITVKAAIDRYQRHYPQATLTGIELAPKLGQNHYTYELEGVDQTHAYTLALDAQSGKVLNKWQERLDADEQSGRAKREDGLALNKLLTLKDVTKRAEKAAGSGKATKWSLERDDGITYWEVSVKAPHHEREVKLAAQSGKILEIDD